MKKIIGLVFLSLLAISASAADLIALSNDPKPTMAANIVVEGTACPGVGATGFSASGLLLSCQSDLWQQQSKAEPDTINLSFTENFGVARTRQCPTGYFAMASNSFSAPSGLQICGTAIINNTATQTYGSQFGGCYTSISSDYGFFHQMTCARFQ